MYGKNRKKKNLRRKVSNIFASSTALEVFLSTCRGNDTPGKISMETGLKKSVVYEYLNLLNREEFVLREPKYKHERTARSPQELQKNYLESSQRKRYSAGTGGHYYHANILRVISLNIHPFRSRIPTGTVVTYSFESKEGPEQRFTPEELQKIKRKDLPRMFPTKLYGKIRSKDYHLLWTIFTDAKKEVKANNIAYVRLCFSSFTSDPKAPEWVKEIERELALEPVRSKQHSYSLASNNPFQKNSILVGLFLKFLRQCCVINPYWRSETWLRHNLTDPSIVKHFILDKRERRDALCLSFLADRFMEYLVVEKAMLLEWVNHHKDFVEKHYPDAGSLSGLIDEYLKYYLESEQRSPLIVSTYSPSLRR